MLRLKKDYYKTIDTLPIANFMQCQEGKLQYLYKQPFDSIKKDGKFPRKFYDVFGNLIYQFDYVDNTLVRILLRASVLNNKYAVTKDITFKNRANRELAEYKRLFNIRINEVKSSFFMDQVVALEEYLKMSIDIYTMTTRKYFAHLKRYEDYINRLKDAKTKHTHTRGRKT